MMDVLYFYLATFFPSMFLLWMMFIVVMTMAQKRDAGLLQPFVLKTGYVLMYIGLLVDVYVQLFVAPIVFLEIPTEMTVSARLRRLVRGDATKWRTKLAIWFAAVLMNPFCPADNPHIPMKA